MVAEKRVVAGTMGEEVSWEVVAKGAAMAVAVSMVKITPMEVTVMEEEMEGVVM